jgi:4-hydroxy-tetrahydrodipicolinate reductase
MGREVEQVSEARGHKVLARIDSRKGWTAAGQVLEEADAVIDFSLPGEATRNIRTAFDHRLAMVEGTTGWHQDLEKVRKWCQDEGQALFYASNFSIGMNIIFSLNRKLAALLNRFEDYDILLEEVHHVHKADAPSGTAIVLADQVIREIDRKLSWINSRNAAKNELSIISRREGEELGTHLVRAESPYDILELKHTIKNRKGLALGAVIAAEWIMGKKGCFTMEDLLTFRD